MKYAMPPEWDMHKGTWLAWPHREDHWPGKLEAIPKTYREIIHALKESEKVFMCVNDKNMEMAARKTLGPSMKNVEFYHIPTDSSWFRDHGPIFVKDEERRSIITDWAFNAWGEKYPPWDQDDMVPERIAKKLGVPCIKPEVILEGGSIDVNGKGTLLTDEQCLLNKNRNPSLTKGEIENYLMQYLGIRHFIWLDGQIVGDDTDGHIDDIARFVDAKTIVCAVEKDKNDENYQVLLDNFEKLKKAVDQDGRALRVIPIPMPEPVFYKGERLPASYINFYIANKVVLVPTFQSKHDKIVLRLFQELFPSRRAMGINCVDLVWGMGTIHCSTQQQPL